MSTSFEELLAGVRRFQNEIYPDRSDRYERAAREPQRPHTLFITCSDSRVDPELITQSGPGEIFVTRNIGNLVPPHFEVSGAVSAVIEYAVDALGVNHIVVCGHTDCGAMKGLLHREKLAALPAVNRWLTYAETALSVLKARGNASGEHAELEQLIGENVLLQIQHLRTHPSVASKLAQKNLSLHGWIYDIGQGRIRIYNSESGSYAPLD